MVISTINYSYRSYVHQLSYLGGHTLYTEFTSYQRVWQGWGVGGYQLRTARLRLIPCTKSSRPEDFAGKGEGTFNRATDYPLVI